MASQDHQLAASGIPHDGNPVVPCSDDALTRRIEGSISDRAIAVTKRCDRFARPGIPDPSGAVEAGRHD